MPSHAAPRRTKQRTSSDDVIGSAHGPMSALEILTTAKRTLAGLGLATVYRTIKSMCEAGVLVEVDVPGEAPRFERAGKSHHHHFLCRKCGRLFEVDGCPGDLTSLTPKGFTLESHELTLLGLCGMCNLQTATFVTPRKKTHA